MLPHLKETMVRFDRAVCMPPAWKLIPSPELVGGARGLVHRLSALLALNDGWFKVYHGRRTSTDAPLAPESSPLLFLGDNLPSHHRELLWACDFQVAMQLTVRT